MKILENINTIISIICGIGSVIMFFCAKHQRDKCIEIKNEINTKIENFNILTKENITNENITSGDVGIFDNRKTYN